MFDQLAKFTIDYRPSRLRRICMKIPPTTHTSTVETVETAERERAEASKARLSHSKYYESKKRSLEHLARDYNHGLLLDARPE